ncbi:MAG: HU family DNA-binding protein [Pseudanabaena sp.]|jgi:nucleoid DNA-binding protein|nr:HU family DNA-binding protein [Pseudanabaena sp. M090S1SP2A07QC]MCA6508205.1 HU family DNA-binding protein [Pseudanabaena sp. M172S2SP2A07QC]MCA6510016.1 HU family DNA-binding protein [Pseudanabaena sp. M109S1SP2A07QC]MCA6522496.1 HU family DNA-binding protein [Pseudanabaena sp. M051S1SP2A07QC]MCA6527237.1 HU family DNA-binding protein [Pseudanabaena sp. M179S2SP2A07QC]MCA6530901.1 HU family DNA-binding protein [Pseudanabaena sp. M125S2SP2A07QC]MCA6533195.1 HU family DNA-binding protein [P
MADINRQDIIRGMMAEVDGLSYSMASASLEAALACVTKALADHQSVILSDFGKFGVRHRRARLGMHPRTHQPIQIPEVNVPHFTPSPNLKKLVQNPKEVEVK